MAYSVLFIDADHTLFDFDQSEVIAFRQLLANINREKDEDTLLPLYIKINRDIWDEMHKGLITQDELKAARFSRFTKAAHIDDDADKLSRQFTNYLSEASILYDGAYEIIKKLSKKYRLVIVTNGLKAVQDKRVRHSVLSPYIEATVISDEIGISKPNPAIIDYALKEIHHSRKDDVVIIGDNLHSDILCGFNAGIDTIWYNPNQEENDLDKDPTHTISSLFDLLKIL